MIGEIWTNPYVQELGISEHLIEIQELKRQLVLAKASDKAMGSNTAKIYKEAIDRELMDLHIILEKWSSDKSELKNKRVERFDEKTRMDVLELLKREA